MSYSKFKIEQGPKRIELRIPKVAGDPNPPLFEKGTEYDMDLESEIIWNPNVGYPGEPLDKFTYRIKPDENSNWSPPIPFVINVPPVPGTPSCQNRSTLVSQGFTNQITESFIFDTSTDRIRIDSIEGQGTLYIDNMPVEIGRAYMIYEFKNISYHALGDPLNSTIYARINFTMGRKNEWGSSCRISLDRNFYAALYLIGFPRVQTGIHWRSKIHIRNGVPEGKIRVRFSPTDELAFFRAYYIDPNGVMQIEELNTDSETDWNIDVDETGAVFLHLVGAKLTTDETEPYLMFINMEIIDNDGNDELIDPVYGQLSIPIFNDESLLEAYGSIYAVYLNSPTIGSARDDVTIEVLAPASEDLEAEINLLPNIGTPPFTYNLVEITTTPGLTITQNATKDMLFDISGIDGAASPGLEHIFEAQVTDANDVTSTKRFTVTVIEIAAPGAVPVVTPPPTKVVNQNIYIDVQPTATNPPIDSWSATGLPAGISIDPATGRITGSSVVDGTHNVNIYATNSQGQSLAAAWVLTIRANTYTVPVITSPNQETWNFGQSNFYQLTYTGSEPMNVQVTNLPTNWYYNSADRKVYGLIQSPQESFTILLSNAAGSTSQVVTIYTNI
jgi:hypothetical protein